MDHADFGFQEEPFDAGYDVRFVYLDDGRAVQATAILAAAAAGIGLITVAGPPGIGKTSLLLHLAATASDRDDLALLCAQGVLPCAEATRFGDIVRACRQRQRLSGDGGGGDSRSGGGAAKPRQLLILDDADDLDPTVVGDLRRMVGLFAAEGERLSVVAAIGSDRWNGGGEGEDWQGRRAETLVAMPAAGITALVRHRLATAGGSDASMFAAVALDRLAQLSGGVPGEAVRLARAALAIARREHAVPILAEIIDEAAHRLGFDVADPAGDPFTGFNLPVWLPVRLPPEAASGASRPAAMAGTADADPIAIPEAPAAVAAGPAAAKPAAATSQPARTSARPLPPAQPPPPDSLTLKQRWAEWRGAVVIVASALLTAVLIGLGGTALIIAAGGLGSGPGGPGPVAPSPPPGR